MALARLAKAERWLVQGAAFTLPLAFFWGTYDHYVIPKLLVMRSAVLIAGVLYCVRAVIARRLVFKRTLLDLPLLAFVASAALSTAFSVNLNVAIFGTYGRYDGLLTICTYAAVFWLVTQVISDGRDAKLALRALIAGAYVVAVIAIVQFVRDSASSSSVARAYGTMGNSDVLGAYLALLTPVAYGETLGATNALGRWLGINVIAVMVLALILSLSRSAWVGLAVAGIVLVAGRQWPSFPRRVLLIGVFGVAAFVAVAATLFLRASPVFSGETLAQRVHVWRDTVPLIASRPITGYGPDTFGLVYPRFQTGNWGDYQQFDKAHSELLQVASTQGLLGVAAYLLLLGAFVVAFWRGRKQPPAWPVLAGWAAYEATLQLNFSALASAAPFWIFAAASVAVWSDGEAPRVFAQPVGSVARIGLVGAALALAVVAIPAVGLPYLADVRLRDAVMADIAGRPEASRFAAEARALAPDESVYAVEAGNIALERHDWSAARDSYLDASRLGTFNPQMYRNLAFADRALGLRADAVWAARQAVYLDRFDPVNQAVLAQMESPGP